MNLSLPNNPIYPSGSTFTLMNQYQQSQIQQNGLFGKPSNVNLPNNLNNQNIQMNSNNNFDTDSMFKNYQITLLQSELRTQSQIILGMKEKIDSLYKLLTYFMKDYQSNMNQNLREELPENELKFQDLIGKGPNDILSSNDLLLYLKGSEDDFDYFLELCEPLSQPLVKERNFS